MTVIFFVLTVFSLSFKLTVVHLCYCSTNSMLAVNDDVPLIFVISLLTVYLKVGVSRHDYYCCRQFLLKHAYTPSIKKSLYRGSSS
uniref:Uncharacterized protein n=1 Tax=Aegilops tauschii subsp. strangulata TaxID=200361 RepID=A0A453NTY9_AEGTS